MNIASKIVQQLTDPGLTLAFCDDSGIDGSPHQDLAPDLRILCAVVMSSENYALIKGQLEGKLKMLGENLIKFHATEIVNPKKTSPWSRLSETARINAWKFLQKILGETTSKLYYAFVVEGEFSKLRKEAEKQGPVNVAWKQGLKRVFLRCLFDRLSATKEKTVVLMHRDKFQASPIIEKCPEGRFLVGGGPISAESALIPGLQLADMAAFSLTRYLRKRPLIAKGSTNPFDTLAAETVAGFTGRIQCLLN
jgi:hypothetical protein